MSDGLKCGDQLHTVNLTANEVLAIITVLTLAYKAHIGLEYETIVATATAQLLDQVGITYSEDQDGDITLTYDCGGGE